MVDQRTKQLVSTSSSVILSTHIEPADDIKEERRKTSFDVNELAKYLNGGEEVLKTRRAKGIRHASIF